MSAALDYLRERSAQFEHVLPGDCVDEACKVAGLLIAEGKRPWLGRIRDRHGDYSGPLHPRRFIGRNAPAYTTHYVCCAEDLAYDPLAGEPVPANELAERIFGRPLPVDRIADDITPASIRRDVYASSSTARAEPHPSTSS